MPQPIIEVCVEGPDGALAAAQGGAQRVELCASLLEGGITPSLGVLHATLEAVQVPVMAMVRPRGGDFLYSGLEFRAMLADVASFRAAKADGVVIGCLTPEGGIDEARTEALVNAAGPLSVTFHRAFDMTRDPEAALESLIRCGVERVLTSGQCASALDGLKLLRRLVQQAGGRIKIMGCGALDAWNIAELVRAGLPELHFAALHEVESAMVWRNPAIGMGGTALEREYHLTKTDPALVRSVIHAALTANEASIM